MVTLHTTNHYIYKQTNPPLQQALAPLYICWYLKGTMYKAVVSKTCENCETIIGDYKSAMAQITCTMEYGICTLGYKSHTTRNPRYNYNFTLYSLQCTPQPTIPTNQSYYSQHTSTHNHSKTMNRELWCVWLERSM